MKRLGNRNIIQPHIKDKMKLLIGLSTGEHIRRAEFLPSFIGLERPNGSFTMTVHGQSPAKSRNLIVEAAIKNECTHIFFLDDDMIPPFDTLSKLMSHDKDIVTGLYLTRTYPHYPALFDKAYVDGKCKYVSLDSSFKQELIPVVNCGLGCVLIATRVFEALEKPYVRLGEIESDGWCDDVGFFNRVRKAGFQIWCDLNAPVGHMANVTIWPEKHGDKWFTNYKHPNGNIMVAQNVITDNELKKQEDELVKV